MTAQSFVRPDAPAARPENGAGPHLQFHSAAPQGFGDRQNSWAWAMYWWRGKLYVGTNRCWHCAEMAAIRSAFPLFVKYPPADPDVACAPDPVDLALQAELWCWTPETTSWERLYQSPRDVPAPGRAGKLLARDIGYRYMASFVEPDGTEALYVAGVNTRFMYRPVPPPRLLRSTDGRTFAPIPADPGTFLGSNDRCTFRTLVDFDRRLFVTTGSVRGEGILLEARDPARGNDSFRQVSPEGLSIFEMAVYNGALYVGSRHPKRGYTVLKTDARGEPPYQFTTVVPEGAFASNPSLSVISMQVFKDRLYVGTDRPAELIRINPDDSWDLVVGPPRATPDGPKEPLSGLDAGFSNWLNGHIWRLESYAGRLYLGTWDMSTYFRSIPGASEVLSPGYGCDLYATEDGWHFHPVTLTGFGDKFNYGIRALTGTPHGLFVGTTNNWYGLQIWRGTEPAGDLEPLAPPARLEAEPVAAGTLLSWEHEGAAAHFRILRAEVRDERGTVEANPLLARLIRIVRRVVRPLMPDLYLPPLPEKLWVPGAYAEVGTTTLRHFVDATAAPGRRYLYYVEAVAPDGPSSPPSNLVGLPLLHPPATFARIEQRLATLSLAATGSGHRLDALHSALAQCRELLRNGEVDRAQGLIDTAALGLEAGAPGLDQQAATDLAALLRKQARRIRLAAAAGTSYEGL